jgi:hypothetical protein
MKRLAVHTLALAVALSCLLACGHGKDKVIPRGKLSRIYEELYLADRWADSKSEYRVQSDTTDFYETILKSYGYTSADYRASVEYYLQDPERFSRILKKTAARLTEKSKELDTSADRIQKIMEMLERAKGKAPKYGSLTDVTLDSLMKFVFAGPGFRLEGQVETQDSVQTRADSIRSVTPLIEEAPVKLKSGEKQLPSITR